MASGMGGMSGMPMPSSSSPSPAAPASPSGPDPVMSGAARSSLLGGDAGDVRYPYYLINGRIRTAPRTSTARPGQRARIRIINAAADTAFRVALGGHRLTVTHTDGYPVAPVQADALLIGMGERYDVTVTLGDGVFPLIALAEGKNATALALVRTASGTPPPAGVRPAELGGRLASYAGLRAAAQARLTARAPDVTYRLRLTGGMTRYDWGINGQAFDMAEPGALRFLAQQGQRVRVVFDNATTMYHPMHIHGHTFALGPAGPAQGHRHRPPPPPGRLRPGRGQPRPVDDPLPQPLPRPREQRHDGPAQLPDLTSRPTGGRRRRRWRRTSRCSPESSGRPSRSAARRSCSRCPRTW